MHVAIKRLGLVSGERIRDELFKCLAVPNFEAVAALFSEFGVFDELRLLTFGADPAGTQSRQVETETLTLLTRLSNMPEGGQQEAKGVPKPDLEHWHTYQVMLDEHLQGGRKRHHLMLLGSILLHIHPAFDVDETSTHELLPEEFSEQIARALLIGQKEKAYFKAVSGGFLRLADLSRHQPGKLDYYRFFRAFGSYGLDSALLAMAEVQSQEPLLQFNPEICREVFHIWFTEQARTVNPPRLVDGDLLQRELAIGPGVKIGTLLEEIREQQVLGKVNTTAEAIAFAQQNIERNA
jgi:tRNA nucleotidyltransferase/poly(A) polymerase